MRFLLSGILLFRSSLSSPWLCWSQWRPQVVLVVSAVLAVATEATVAAMADLAVATEDSVVAMEVTAAATVSERASDTTDKCKGAKLEDVNGRQS